MRTRLAVGLALAVVAFPARAEEPFAGLSKEDIFQQSLDTPSLIERERARVYLSKRWPDSGEGMFAAAWLAGRQGDAARSAQLYEACLAAHPGFHWCLSNYLANEQQADKPENLAAARARFEAMGRDRYQSDALRNLYAAYFRTDKAAMEPLLERHAAGLRSSGLGWKLAYLRGLGAVWEKDYDRALALFDEAIAEGGEDFDIWRAAADARRAQVSPARLQADHDLLDAVIAPLLAYARQHPGDASALLYIAELTDGLVGRRDVAIRMFKAAFEAHPHPEPVSRVKAISSDEGDVAVFLDYARERLPGDPMVEAEQALFQMDRRLDFAQASALFEAAVPRMADDALRRPMAKDYAALLEDVQWDWDRARDFRLRYGADPKKEAASLLVNRFRAGDYAGAKAILDDPQSDLHPDYREFYRARVERAEAYAARRVEAAPYLAFLDAWSQARVPDAGAPERSVWFAPGSAELSAEGKKQVAAAARLLKGAGDLVGTVEVAGFAETGESADLAGLAARRADAVRAALQAQSGLPAGTFVPLALADRFGSHEAGGNRRVTLTPLASFGKAQVLAPTAAGSSHLAVSPDGRFLIRGMNTHNVFDLASGRIVSRLGRGKNPEFSPNGRMVAMASDYTETGGYHAKGIYIYDRLTGLRLHSIPFAQVGTDRLTWAPDSSAIAFVDAQGVVFVYDLATRTRRWVARPNRQRINGRIAWSPDGRSIAYAPAQARQAYLLDARTGAVSRTLPGVDWPLSLAWSPDGSRLALADNARAFHVWDTAGWAHRTTTIAGHPMSLLAIDGTARTAFQGIRSNGGDDKPSWNLEQIDLASAAVVASRSLGSDVDTALGDRAQRIYLSRDDVEVRDASDFSVVQTLAPAATRLELSIAPEGCSCFLTADSTGTHVWSAVTGRKIHSFAEVAGSLAAVPGGKDVIALVDGRLFRLDLTDYLARDVGPALLQRGEAQRLVVRGNFLAIAGVSDPRENRAIVEVRRLDRLGPNDAGLVNQLAFPVVTETKTYQGLFNARVSSHDIDEEGRRVVVATAWSDGFGHGATYSREGRVFDLATGEQLQRLRPDRPVDWVRFAARDGEAPVRVGSNGWVYPYDAQGRGLKSFTRGEDAARLKRGERAFTVVQAGTLTVEIDWLDDGRPPIRVTAGEDLKNYYAMPDLNLLVLVRADNSFSFHDLETGELAMTVVSQRGSEWLAYTPEGIYAASLGGARAASLAFGTVLRPLEANAEKLESRSLVAARLAKVRGGAKDLEAEKMFAQSGNAVQGGFMGSIVRPTARSVPLTVPYKLEMLSPASMKTQTNFLSLQYRVSKLDPKAPEPALVFDLNGQRFSSGARATLDADGVFTQSFPLEPGRNFVQVALSYRGATFNPVTALIERTGGQNGANGQRVAAQEARPRPRLFVLGIGVSQYQDTKMNLKYADKDVRAVAELLEGQKDKLFSDVRVMLMTNADVRSEEVRIKGLREFLTQATSEDVIVIYLAGHGAQDVDQTLYLLSNDADFDRPYTGIDMTMFRDFLKRRPVGQKAILFMDMCQAGSLSFAEEGARSTRLGSSARITSDDVGNLLKGTGTMIFASSKGASPSFESAEWEGGHGAFTAAVLRALRGAADGGGAKPDGMVDVLELQNYVLQAVPELTAKRQEPTIVGSSNISPYALAEKP